MRGFVLLVMRVLLAKRRVKQRNGRIGPGAERLISFFGRRNRTRPAGKPDR